MTAVQRATLVTTNPPANGNQTNTQLALFHVDGSQVVAIKKQANQVDSVAADLTAMKVDFNALLLKLRNAGILG